MSLYVNTSMPFCVHLQFAEATHRPMCIIKTGDLTLRLLMSYIQGVTGGMDQTSGECSLC